jgi:hypothetical protein
MTVPVFLRLHPPGRWHSKLVEAMRSDGTREHAVDWLCMVYLLDDLSVMHDASRPRHPVDVLGTPNETPVGMWGGAPDRPND